MNGSLINQEFALKFFNLKELLITDTELKDIASAANIGFKIPSAARGIPSEL